MTFLEKIQTLPDKKMIKVVKRRIRYLEDKVKEDYPEDRIIGYHIDYNFSYCGNEGETEGIELNCLYNDFITKDSKLVYGMCYSEDGFVGNRGMYYYVDDQSYLYDFCRYIRDMKDINDYYFFGYIRDFLKEYFGSFRDVDRNQMLSLLSDSNGILMAPYKEHSISSFKGKGNAYCTEYAVMAQNILQLFGYDSSIVVGEAVFDEEEEGHAYNLISFKECDTGENVDIVIDFINPIDVYDISFKKIGEEPFIGYIENLDKDLVERFVLGKEHFIFNEYYFMDFPGTLMKIETDSTRDYSIGDVIVDDEDVNYSKMYKSKQKTML